MRILSIVNPAGGVGKTTTAINLSAALAAIGERVLLLDLDPQGNASTGVGVAADARAITTFDVLSGKASIAKAAARTLVPNLSIVPANAELAGIETELIAETNRPFRLREATMALIADQKARPAKVRYTYLIIDCPPTESALALNAMVAAHAVLAPVQCEFFALAGISRLKETIDQTKATLNPGLVIHGVLLTMYDAREPLSKEVASEVRAFFGAAVYETMIPRNVRVAEATSHGKPIMLYDYDCPGSQAYFKLATEVAHRYGGLPIEPGRPRYDAVISSAVMQLVGVGLLWLIHPMLGAVGVGLAMGWYIWND